MKKIIAIAFISILHLFSNAALSDPIVLRMATGSGDKGSPAANALDMWARIIEKKTKGTPEEIKVNVFYGHQLGNAEAVFDLLMAGDVDLMLTWPSTSYDQRIGLRLTPYLFVTWKQALEAYRPSGWMYNIYSTIFADNGLKFLGAWPDGFSGVATTGAYATTVEEANGIRVRVSSHFPQAITLRAMGYEPLSIPWGEVYTSLQTGIVDGDGSNVIYWDYEYFGDLIDYYVKTRHTFVTAFLAMNWDTWSSLSNKQKKIVADAATKVSKERFQNARDWNNEYYKKARNSGIQVIRLPSAKLNTLAERVRQKVWPKLKETFGNNIVELIKRNAPKLHN